MAALSALAAAALLFCADYANAATRVVRVSPFEPNGQVKNGVRVTSETEGECGAAGTFARGSYRCSGDDHFIREPCWPDITSERLSVLCLTYPWSRRATRVYPAGLLEPSDYGPGVMWGATLANGKRCFFIQGTGTLVRGQRVNYRCDKRLHLLGTPDRSRSTWRIRMLRLLSPTTDRYAVRRRARIRVAWYGARSHTHTCQHDLYPRSGIGLVTASGRSVRCADVILELEQWVDSGQSKQGPPGWTCAVTEFPGPGPATVYDCGRADGRVRFGVGG